MKQPSRMRIESNFAALQGLYWAGACALTAFTAVYLSWQGLSDGQIGYTASLIYLVTIVLSLLLSGYSDRHPAFPLKKLMTLLFLAALFLTAGLHLLPMPLALLISASTVLTKQHYFIDIPGGWALALLCWLLMRRLDPGSRWEARMQNA